MINYTMQQFYDDLYYGADIFFQCGKYFYQIGTSRTKTDDPDIKIHGIHMYKTDCDFHYSDAPSTFYDEIFNEEDIDREGLIERFLNAPLFDGKSFYEVEQDVEIIST